jgi:Holliday junction resolvase RusA-like endonuclease
MTDLNTYVHSMNKSRWGGNSIKQQDTNFVALICSNPDIVRITKPAKLHFTWFVPDHKKDPDNIAFKKSIMDGLVKAGVIVNDTQRYIKGFSDDFVLDKENPRIEIAFEIV